MEHIVQFAIGIDDNEIRKNVIRTAEKQIVEQIKQDLTDRLFSSRGWNKHASPEDPLSSYALALLADYLEENKDAIVDRAAKYLADRVSKCKSAQSLKEE